MMRLLSRFLHIYYNFATVTERSLPLFIYYCYSIAGSETGGRIIYECLNRLFFDHRPKKPHILLAVNGCSLSDK